MRRNLVTLAAIAAVFYAACAYSGEGAAQKAPAIKDPARTSQKKVAAPAVLNVTDSTFKKEVLSPGQPVLAIFWSPQCGPCEEVTADLASSLAGKAKVVRVNTKMAYKAQAVYHIKEVPTFVLFKGGKAGGRAIGMLSKEQLYKRLGLK